MSAKVLRSSTQSKREIARITTRDDARPMKEVQSGTEIEVKDWVLQEVTNERTGEIFQSIVIVNPDNELFATRSEFFIKKFFEIIDILADEEEPDDGPFIIRVTKGKGRSGNEFTSCALA